MPPVVEMQETTATGAEHRTDRWLVISIIFFFGSGMMLGQGLARMITPIQVLGVAEWIEFGAIPVVTGIIFLVIAKAAADRVFEGHAHG